LTELGILATTSGSASSARATDWSPLQGSSVIIWPDNDPSGFKYGKEVAKRLEGVAAFVRLIDIAKLELPEKGDVVDWLAENPGATSDDIYNLPTVEPPKQQNKEKSSDALFQDIDPWPEPVHGDEVLREVEQALTDYVSLPQHAAVAVTLWVVLTYLHDNIRISPILGITSPQKRCGKTTLLTILDRLVWRALPTNNITPAALFRTTEKFSPTLLIDEADTFLGQSDELRGIVNSGHTKAQAYVIRTVGEKHEPQKFTTWAPKAIALIGKLPDTTRDRSIEIRLERKKSGDVVKRLRLDGDEAFLEIRRKLLRWALDSMEQIAAAEPGLPPQLHDRAADNWEPLLAIAERAGGDWLRRAAEAAQALTKSDGDEDGADIQLLADIRDILRNREYIPPGDLHTKLLALDDRPWAEWSKGSPITKRKIGDVLRKFDIKSHSKRAGEFAGRAYWEEDFADVFARYLPDTSVHCGTAAQRSNDAVLSDSHYGTRSQNVPQSNSGKASVYAGCAAVPQSLGDNGPDDVYVPGADG
ncbi:MAG: DUF3631 domain-containing protein, partial [Gammaproteobacteria bacterium]|nr:DUF3631 domain-containing protein [Gammaproteobacteria bacterium]